jgi:hypothetical protein
MSQADVAAVLEALRAEVRAQRAAQSPGDEGSAVERELRHAVEQLEIARVVSAHWPLAGRTLYERAWVLVHKVVRRGLQWYIPPIVAQQNAFNDAATQAIRLLAESNQELRAQLARQAGGAGQLAPHDPLPPASPLTPDHPQSAPNAAPTASVAPDPTAAARLDALVATMGERAAVNAHLPLGGLAAPALARRTLRQYLRWLVNPIVEQQNAFNAALVAAVARLTS